MRRLLVVLGAVLALAAAVPAAAQPPEPLPGNQATYEVTVTNLTTRGGQWFTPPLVVAHRPAVDLFEVGEPANQAIIQIAENGNLGPALELADSSIHVLGAAVLAGSPPPLAPEASISGELTAHVSATRLSFASMLICTNDGFTGVDSVRLPTRVGETVTVHGEAYDAGSEINTEDLADIVPPCQALSGVSDDQGAPGTAMSDPALAENGVITHHRGITGDADLVPSIHGWTNPVSEIEITRTG